MPEAVTTGDAENDSVTDSPPSTKNSNAPRKKGVSLGETTYQALRHDIVLGALPPGTRLHLSERAKAQGVSLSIIREAVVRLASEGLLDATPQRGFSVPQLSVDDLTDLTWTRVHIETLALSEAITHGDLTWESELVAAHHELSATPIFDSEGAFNREWMKAHGRFHAALAAGCPYPRLRNLRQQLFDASELYRYWSNPGNAPSSQIIAEHKALTDAALARDTDAAVALLTLHLKGTATRLTARGVFLSE